MSSHAVNEKYIKLYKTFLTISKLFLCSRLCHSKTVCPIIFWASQKCYGCSLLKQRTTQKLSKTEKYITISALTRRKSSRICFFFTGVTKDRHLDMTVWAKLDISSSVHVL